MSPNHLAPLTNKVDLATRRFWVFDMDGTLTLAQHDFAGIKRKLDLPADQGILEALQAMSESRRQVVEQAVDEWEYELAGEAQAATGAWELLRMLKGQGVQCGVLTRNSKRNALKTLAATDMLQFFSEGDILGRHEAAPKPSPEGILYLLQRWQGQAEAAMMVGDFQFDLEAGRAAGCSTVHVDVTGEFTWPELSDWAVTDLGKLIPLIA